MPKVKASRNRTAGSCLPIPSGWGVPQLNKALRVELNRLRKAARITKPIMPGYLRDGRKVSTNLYIGSSHKVAGPDHLKFRELGRIYYCRAGRIFFPGTQEDIPIGVLQGSPRLGQLLRHRAMLKGWALTRTSTEAQVPDDDEIEFVETNDMVVDADDIEVPTHVNSDDTIQDDDDEGEIVTWGLRPYTVKVVVQLTDNTQEDFFLVIARPELRYKLSLNYMKIQLKITGVEEDDVLERYLPTGEDLKFVVQAWDRPFVVPQGETLFLRLSGCTTA
ncbi:hypothetical protein V5O48_018907 [Marasmius crinis-equi]|uniref:Polyprotein n=1 Tax=Marasmius crinis-equi TaxID=585013 RepID=A0ABR3EJY8_9AGAR